MSTTARMTFIGMYNYDSTLFDSLTFPEGVNKSTAVDTFLLNYGECRVLYPDPDFTKAALAVWSLKNAEPISRIVAALNAEYNPIHNFDRHEEYSDTESTSDTASYTGSETTGYTGSETTEYTGSDTISESESSSSSETDETTISAYNSSTYQPDNNRQRDSEIGRESSRDYERDLLDTHTRNLSDTHSRNLADSRSGNRRLNHVGHLYGNIGVTKSQEMVRDEVSLRTTLAIYDIIADMLHRDFCLYYY